MRHRPRIVSEDRCFGLAVPRFTRSRARSASISTKPDSINSTAPDVTGIYSGAPFRLRYRFASQTKLN